METGQKLEDGQWRESKSSSHEDREDRVVRKYELVHEHPVTSEAGHRRDQSK